MAGEEISISDPAETFPSLSFDEACAKAAAEKKVVFIDFYTTWCGPCKKLDATTWKDESIIRWLSEKTIPLRLDAEKETELAKKYRIEAYPSLLFIKPDGTEMDRLVGYKTAKEFLDDAEAALSGKDSLARAKEKLNAAGSDAPMARLAYARALIQAGKDDEALTHLLWCYDEGVKHDPAFVGVRGSFLVSEIARFGRKHPPASEEIRKRRDAVRDRILAGQAASSDASDFSSLNDALDESDQTLAVYDKLRKDHPDWTIVKMLGAELIDQLLAAHRYEEIAQFTDIDAKVKNALRIQDMSKEGMAGLSEEERKHMELFHRQYIVADLCRYYAVLVGLAKQDQAAALAEIILKVDASDETYNALAWSGYCTSRPFQANLDQALKANELARGNRADIIDTLARVQGALGQTGAARVLLKEALPRFNEPRDRQLLEKCLEDLAEESAPIS